MIGFAFILSLSRKNKIKKKRIRKGAKVATIELQIIINQTKPNSYNKKKTMLMDQAVVTPIQNVISDEG